MSVDNATTTLVINPTAGRGKALRMLPKVLKELMRGLPEGSLTVRQANAYADAEEYCREAVETARLTADARDSLVVMGGDGLMHLGLNAAAGSGVPLGLIPAGTGNDICRGLGIPLDPIKAAHVVSEASTIAMDLSSVVGDLAYGASQRYVGSVVATGFDARVGIRGASMSRGWGSLAYAVAALAELRTFEPLTYRLRIDGEERVLPAMFIAVANAAYFGGGMKVAPKASVTDGKLDITIVHPVSKFTLLRLLPRMFDGSFVHDPAIECLQATEVVIDGEGLVGLADGEALGRPPFGVVCEPGVLSVFVPNRDPLTKRRKQLR
ncbi:MAG: diacylglycerol kinase family lipid kinase [Propionibacteriaceae bacterium]|jgi:diacylglycerol kinase (ATP)|nr:diacylglycerol kinase family lipid kinase [Propionibacteriaceae bacterium]